MRIYISPIPLLLLIGCSDDTPSLSTSNNGTTTAESSDGGPDPTTASSDSTSDATGGPEPEVPACNPEDDLEPNNIEDMAFVLDNITDNDGSGSLVESILAGDQDVDWFAYMGQDVAFAYVDPAGMLEASMDLRLCLYVECPSGLTPTPTCIDSSYDESPEGRAGCCKTGEGAFVSIDLTCPDGGGDDSAYVFMRVDRGHGDTCVPYDLEYHF